MGIKNFYKFVERYAKTSIKTNTLNNFMNETLLIDANMMIYKNIMAIRKNGYDILINNHSVTHIHSMLNKLLNFRKYNINAIFIFDGKPPRIKNNILKQREKSKNIMKNKYLNANEQDKKKYFYYKQDITEKEIQESIELIKIFGYKIITFETEADILLAYLSKKLNAYVITDDFDILMFNGKKIIKNFSVNKKFITIDLDKIKKESKFNQNMLIVLSLLLGSDYASSIKGIGPIKGYELVKKYKNLEGLYKNKIINKKEYDDLIKGYDFFKKNHINKFDLPKYKKLHKQDIIKNLDDFLKSKNYSIDKINKIYDNIN